MSDYYHNIEEELSLDIIRTNRVLKHVRHQRDRIFELETKLAKAGRDLNVAKYNQPDFLWQVHLAAMDDMQVKLDRAVEALEGVREFVRELEPYADQGHTLVPALKKACTILAELKGQDDE